MTRPIPKETKDLVLKLWNAKHSSNQIAGRLGITKNSVVSMLRRMRKAGLVVRTEPKNGNPYKQPRSKAIKKAKAKLVYIPIVPPDKKFISPRRVSMSRERWVPLLSLGFQTCRFTKDGKHFCNAPTTKDKSWCDEHEQIVFQAGSMYRLTRRAG
jgi:hypothetical protein